MLSSRVLRVGDPGASAFGDGVCLGAVASIPEPGGCSKLPMYKVEYVEERWLLSGIGIARRVLLQAQLAKALALAAGSDESIAGLSVLTMGCGLCMLCSRTHSKLDLVSMFGAFDLVSGCRATDAFCRAWVSNGVISFDVPVSLLLPALRWQ